MKKTKVVQVGNIKIGGGNPISVQSMCNTDTRDAIATVKQIHQLEEVGCEIIRVAVPDMIAAQAIKEIKKNITIPLVADIHFDYKLALESIKNGVDKVRINPGNIGSDENVRKVVDACKDKKIPIRIGINTGSLEKEAEAKYGRTAQAMVESALKHIQILEKLNFHDIVISLKASDIDRTVEAYRLLSQKVDYPLHLGITEAGTLNTGIIKSSVGLGIMLFESLGDTIRVSLTGDCTEEVRVGWEILKSLKLRSRGVNLISCPTCGRTEIDLIGLANKVEKALIGVDKPITVAVMGCVVNGPGEAKEADIGVAGGHKQGVIFKKGQVLRTVPEEKILEELMSEINKL
ncbi:MAG: flavodoxin-dependent (E)-4-hydroxy-3-methylbut-2-enyl-diphosphate synthase [Candidatus Shapirobacteria bacterium]|nr:flavodoxin-dependent (E)-4-hydroxy-3-methylbut-2-enyl-diphosphate synthase [Candidatus Shapirobacteria bacterium]